MENNGVKSKGTITKQYLKTGSPFDKKNKIKIRPMTTNKKTSNLDHLYRLLIVTQDLTGWRGFSVSADKKGGGNCWCAWSKNTFRTVCSYLGHAYPMWQRVDAFSGNKGSLSEGYDAGASLRLHDEGRQTNPSRSCYQLRWSRTVGWGSLLNWASSIKKAPYAPKQADYEGWASLKYMVKGKIKHWEH